MNIKIAPCIWFDDQAEEAARFYVSVFPNSGITKISKYGEAGHEIHRRPAGSVMTVSFKLAEQPFTALNGGPLFQFNEAISLQIFCESQQEIDHFWNALSQDGDKTAQQCGWLKDKFGLSWQVVPEILDDMLSNPTSPDSQRAFQAMMDMEKLDIAALKKAYQGGKG